MANGSNSPIHATAQTLNYALGNLGGQPKSWMLQASSTTIPTSSTRVGGPVPSAQPNSPAPPPRRRGRPPKNARPELPPNIATGQTPVEPQAERQPSSTSASPHLANRLTCQDRRPSVTVLPSPTPSVENIALPNGPSAGPAPSFDFFSFDAAQTDGAVGDAADAASSIRKMRQSKRPSTDMNAQPTKRPHSGMDGHLRSATTTSASASTQHAAISQPQSTGTVRTLPVQFPSTYHPHADMMRPQPVPSSHTPANAQERVVRPRAMLPYNPAVTTINMPVQNTQQANISTWYTSGECLQALDTYKRSRGAAGSPGERGRLDLLESAIFKEDWMYLMIHQLYCLHDVQPSALPQFILSQAAWPDALHMLRSVLDLNSTLSPQVQFFANFPYPLHTIQMRWSYRLNELLSKFSIFVFSSSRYTAFINNCQHRRYPPLVSELVGMMAIESPVLQQAMFTSVLRSIWQAVPDSDSKRRHGREAFNYLHRSQTEFNQRRMQSAAQGQHQPDQLNQGNRWDSHWKALFKQVIDACVSGEGDQSNAAPSHVTAVQQKQRQQQQIQQQTVLLQQAEPSHQNSMARRSQLPAVPYPNQPRHTGRPQPQPVPHSLNPQSQSRINTHLLPPPGVRLPQQRQPNPARFSLHQAYVRSPIPKARSMAPRLYQYVEGFLKSPARLTTANRAIEKWTFTLHPNMVQTIAATVPGAPGQPDHRLVHEDTKTLRLRCIKWTASDRPEDHIWATADTSWIPYSCFNLNGILLEQRRKVHNGKDLPIDITKLLKEGENVLEIMVTTDSHDNAYLDYLVAIEFLGIASHGTVKRECLEKRFESAEEIMAKLKAKLSSGSDEDDDVAIVDSKLTINLLDPFSASSICDIPVRSRVCLHNDCFDLETFLGTRRRKGDVSDPDLWRCPICRADARPGDLITDGFLVHVKEVLAARGQSQTRAIVVHKDGSWKPKEEMRDPNGVSDQSPTPSERQASAAAEIIDISD